MKFQDLFPQSFARTSVKTLFMETIGHHGQNNPFSMSNNPKASKNPILPIFGTIVHHLFCWSETLRSFRQKITWTSVNTLSMELVGHCGQPVHFEGQTSLEQVKPSIFAIFVCYNLLFFCWSRIPWSFLQKIYMNVRQKLIYRADWSSRLKQSIFIVKWANGR